MAGVTLTRVWFHDGADLSDYLVLPWLDLSEAREVPGETRTYAGGRRRAVRRAGTARTFSLAFPYVTPSQLEDLLEREGVEQLYRDSRGRLERGNFWRPQIAERRNSSIVSVSLTFEPITWTEAV